MSCAKIGSSAVAPPRNTATMSRLIAPNSTGRERMKWSPATSVVQLTFSRTTFGIRCRIAATSIAASANDAAAVAKTKLGPNT
jgi:hypothetical protein